MDIDIETEESSIFLCPKCKLSIPMFTIVLDQGEPTLELICQCTDGVFDYKLDKYLDDFDEINKIDPDCKCMKHPDIVDCFYCIRCFNWWCEACICTHGCLIKKFVKRKVNVFCIHHKSYMGYYCIDCTKLMCYKCNNDHETHRVIKDKDNFNKKLNKCVKEIPEKNKRFIDAFNKWINASGKPLDDMKTDINKAYEENNRITTMLVRFYRIIKQTMKILAYPNPPFQLGYSLNQIIGWGYYKPNISYKDLDSSFKNLKSYYEDAFPFILHNKKTKEQLLEPKPTYKCVKTIEIKENIFVLKQLHDGRLISSGENKMIKLWDSTTLECIKEIDAQEEWIKHLIQLKDGRVISYSKNHLIKVWSIETFECLNTIQTKEPEITNLIELQDGRLLSTGKEESPIRIWDTDTFECVENNEFKYVSALIQLQDERIVLSSGDSLHIWTISPIKSVKTIIEKEFYCKCFYQLRNGKLITGSNSPKLIKIWNISTFECIKTITNIDYIINFVELDDGRLVSHCQDDHMALYDMSTYKPIHIFKVDSESGNINSVIQLNHTTILSMASCYIKSTFRIWEI